VSTGSRSYTSAEVRAIVAGAIAADRAARTAPQAQSTGREPAAAAVWRAFSASIAVLTRQVTAASVPVSDLIEDTDPEMVIRSLAAFTMTWIRLTEPERTITGLLASFGELAALEQARLSQDRGDK